MILVFASCRGRWWWCYHPLRSRAHDHAGAHARHAGAHATGDYKKLGCAEDDPEVRVSDGTETGRENNNSRNDRKSRE